MWRCRRATRASATETERLDGMEIEKESRAEDRSLAFPANQPPVPLRHPNPPSTARPRLLPSPSVSSLIRVSLLTLSVLPQLAKRKRKKMHPLAAHHLGLDHHLLIVSLGDGVSPISFLNKKDGSLFILQSL